MVSVVTLSGFGGITIVFGNIFGFALRLIPFIYHIRLSKFLALQLKIAFVFRKTVVLRGDWSISGKEV